MFLILIKNDKEKGQKISENSRSEEIRATCCEQKGKISPNIWKETNPRTKTDIRPGIQAPEPVEQYRNNLHRVVLAQAERGSL